jgi:septal ring factor EnvC (AmiA/AmiB activator)
VQVEALEHDKHVVTTAFERVLRGLQTDLLEVKQRLEDLRFERDQLASRLSSTENALANTKAELAGVDQERRQLRATLDAERGTVLVALSKQQQQQVRQWLSH